MTEPLRIGAVVGVKDEIDLMPRALDHLGAIGVDATIVCDRGSTDGTREFLEGQERGGRVHVLDMDPLESLSDGRWGEAQLDAASSTGADWVLFLEPEERNRHVDGYPGRGDGAVMASDSDASRL